MAALHPSDPLFFLYSWPDSPAASRPVRLWAAHPRLPGVPAGTVARKAAWQPALFEALTAREGDPVATTAALAAVAVHLRPVVARWRRAGLGGEELADAAGDLVEAALVEIRRPHPGDARAVADRAWQYASGRRRIELARAARTVPLDWGAEGPAPTDSLAVALSVVTDALAAGVVTVTLAAALWAVAVGWSAVDAARQTGTSPEAWWARTSRAARAVRRAHTDTDIDDGAGAGGVGG